MDRFSPTDLKKKKYGHAQKFEILKTISYLIIIMVAIHSDLKGAKAYEFTNFHQIFVYSFKFILKFPYFPETSLKFYL